MKGRQLLILLLVMFSSSTYTMEIVYESEHTFPANRYTEINENKVEDVLPKQREKREKLFPIVTSMLPGKFTSKKVDIRYMTTPIFLIGHDPVSIQWLKDHYETLLQLKAVGMVISARSEQDYYDLVDIASPIPLFPGAGDDIGKLLAVSVYPFLISNGIVEQ